MLVPLSTTSKPLSDLLTAAQAAQVAASVQKQDGRYFVTIDNPSAIIVYLEIGAVATAAASKAIPVTTGTFSFVTDNLSKVNLIAASGTPNVVVTVS